MKHICRSPTPLRRRLSTRALLVCSLHTVTSHATSFFSWLAMTGDRCSGCGDRVLAMVATFTSHISLLRCLWQSCLAPARGCAAAAWRAKTSTVTKRTSRQSLAGCHRLNFTSATRMAIPSSSSLCWTTHQKRALLDHCPSGAKDLTRRCRHVVRSRVSKRDYAGVYFPARTPVTTISATPARHNTAIRMSRLNLGASSFLLSRAQYA